MRALVLAQFGALDNMVPYNTDSWLVAGMAELARIAVAAHVEQVAYMVVVAERIVAAPVRPVAARTAVVVLVEPVAERIVVAVGNRVDDNTDLAEAVDRAEDDTASLCTDHMSVVNRAAFVAAIFARS